MDQHAPLPFLTGGGEMGERLRSHDWSATPLGDPAGWHPSLKTLTGVMLGAVQPMFIAWGSERTLLYNDAYAPLLGRKHPDALGWPFFSVWPEIQDEIGPLFEQVFAGQPIHRDDITLFLERHGRLEEAHFAFSYTPVRDERGAVAGLFCSCAETTAQVLAERQRMAQTERQRRLFEQAPGFICIMGGPDHVFEFVNDAHRRLFGERDWVGGAVRNVFAELAGQGFFELLDQVYATGERFVAHGAPARIRTSPDGPEEERFLDFIYEPVTDEAGQVTGIFCEGFEVTEAHRAAAALRESEAEFRAIFEQAAVGVAQVGFDGRWLRVNKRLCAMLGYSEAELLARTFQQVTHPEDLEPNLAHVRRLLAGEAATYEMEKRYLKRDGGIVWAALASALLRDPGSGAPLHFISVAEDITARKQVEAALRELNAMLEQRIAEALAGRKVLADIVEGTDAFVQVADLGYRWLAINRAAADEFERIFGVRPRVGDNMLDLLAGQPEQQAAVKAVWDRALAGEEFTETAEFGEPGRDRRYYEMKFNVLRGADGERIGAYQFVTDVSERLREQTRLAQAEDALRQSQKMEAVGQLTGGLAHDFNNLLTGITGSLELLQTRIMQGRLGDADRYVAAAQGAAKRAAALTHRLLAFSRRQTLDPKPTDVNRLVAGMEDLIRRTMGPAITVEMVAAGGLWTTLIDSGQLENALLNLCINARDAMPDGGRLTVETANKWLDTRAARERELDPGQFVTLCVSDTGTGMRPDVIRRAFDPFFTTKPIGMGTGLGLSMVHGFARQSGGQVRIYSEPGQGAMVCLYLPRQHGPDSDADLSAEAGVPPRRAAGRGETVLVVDDEPTVRMLVVEVLEDLGYATLEAADGATGLEVLRSDTRVDLLITDVGLPGGMNGRQVADAGRTLRPGLKVLFITGYAENAVVGNGHLDPGMHVLTKPFAMEALASRIRDIVTGS